MGQTATTEAIPIWRSDAQPALLYCLFYDAHARTASAIAERFGLSRQAVSTEARRLSAAGIIRQEVVGRNKVLAILEDHPAISALRTLVDLTVGPLVDLKRLYDVEGVERVMVFGSWARRHLGEPGPTPRDVDVLVVGTPDDYAVTSVCLDLSGQYGVEVSPMIVSSDEFATRGRNPILDQISSGPLVEVGVWCAEHPPVATASATTTLGWSIGGCATTSSRWPRSCSPQPGRERSQRP